MIFLKKSLSICLIFLYLSAINGNLFSFLGYYFNRDYIIKNLCIEKDEEVNTCQGCCHLKKSLQRVDDEPNNSELPVKFTFPERLDSHLINLLFHCIVRELKFEKFNEAKKVFLSSGRPKPEIPPPKEIA